MSPLSEGAEEKLAPHHAWMPAFSLPHLGDPSTLILLAANLIPLVGVLFWGWDLFILMMLYWLETAIIGFWHILRMAITVRWLAVFLVPFFVVHFGMFMGVHFILLRSLFGQAWSGKVHGASDFIHVILIPTGLWIPALALFISHGVSFYLNFLNDRGPTGPLTQAASQDLMGAPYKRVMVMHFTIIFGGMISLALHSPKAAFLLLVALKTSVDLGAHIRKNFKPVQAPTAQPPTLPTP